jgi:hypothetical protein
MIKNIFTKPPAHGRISNWLGPQMVQRLLDFAQAQRDSFVSTGIGHDETARVDLNVRRSSRIKDLGDLKKEIQAKIRDLLPEMFRRLGTEAFEPSRLEVEMVAHGDGAFFNEHCDTASKDKKFVVRRVVSAVYYFPGSRNPFRAALCGSILWQAAKNPTPLSKSSRSTTRLSSFRPGSRTRFCRSCARLAGSRIRVFAINCWVYP